jgi:hypothetical protein
MKAKTLLLITFLSYFAIASRLFCSDFASPISPAEEPRDQIIGGLVGFGQNMQNGTAYVACEDCYFTDGVGFGYTIGAIYETQFVKNTDSYFRNFKVGALLHLSNKNFSSSYREKRQEYFEESDLTIPLTYRQTNVTSVITTGLMPYITYNPFKYFFLKLGFDASLVLSDNIRHEMELLTRKTTLENGEIVDNYFPHPNNPDRKTYKTLQEDGTISDINNAQFSVVPALGFDIYFSDKVFMSPSFQYGFALNKISNFGENYKINNWRINLELKYNFATSNKIYVNEKKKIRALENRRIRR